MADQIDILKRLQSIDGDLFRLRRQEREKPTELEAVAAEVRAQEERLKGAEAGLKALQLSQKEKEVDLQTREASVKKLQGQLFQVKTNKEYSAMQREIDTLKADNSLLEEAILSLFESIDQAAKSRQSEQARLAEQQQRLVRERQRIESEIAAISGQIAQLERARKLLLPDVPPKALEVYERVLKIREGLALVPIVSESCGGCYRRLPPQVVNEVYLKTDLVTCESCNRILYCDETAGQL